jgi:hypothetical protein
MKKLLHVGVSTTKSLAPESFVSCTFSQNIVKKPAKKVVVLELKIEIIPRGSHI